MAIKGQSRCVSTAGQRRWNASCPHPQVSPAASPARLLQVPEASPDLGPLYLLGLFVSGNIQNQQGVWTLALVSRSRSHSRSGWVSQTWRRPLALDPPCTRRLCVLLTPFHLLTRPQSLRSIVCARHGAQSERRARADDMAPASQKPARSEDSSGGSPHSVRQAGRRTGSRRLCLRVFTAPPAPSIRSQSLCLHLSRNQPETF